MKLDGFYHELLIVREARPHACVAPVLGQCLFHVFELTATFSVTGIITLNLQLASLVNTSLISGDLCFYRNSRAMKEGVLALMSKSRAIKEGVPLVKALIALHFVEHESIFRLR